VVSEVVFLLLAHVLGQLGVVQRVVHAVVDDIRSERSRDDAIRDPGGEDEVTQLREGCLQYEEQ